MLQLGAHRDDWTMCAVYTCHTLEPLLVGAVRVSARCERASADLPLRASTAGVAGSQHRIAHLGHSFPPRCGSV